MKNLLLLISLLFTLISYSQTQGIAIYKMEFEGFGIDENLKKENPQSYANDKKMENGAIKVAEQLEYELVFDGHQSRFEMRELMAIDGNINFLTVANLVSRGTFYNDLQNQKRLNQVKEFGQELLVQLDPIEWQITGETAIIRGFKCRKAKTDKIVHGRDGIIKHPVEAWFTTEIPLNFGPVGYAGLPGLIVQLELNNRKFYLHELQEKENVIMPSPTGKPITSKELTLMFRRAMGNMAPNN